MNQYVFVLNEQGERITSFVDNMISKDELLDHAKKNGQMQRIIFTLQTVIVC